MLFPVPLRLGAKPGAQQALDEGLLNEGRKKP